MGAIWWRKQCCFRAGSSFLIWFVTLSEQDLETDFIPCHSIWKRKRSRISIDPNYFGDIFTRLSIAVRNYQISFLIQTYENSIVFHLTSFKKYLSWYGNKLPSYVALISLRRKSLKKARGLGQRLKRRPQQVANGPRNSSFFCHRFNQRLKGICSLDIAKTKLGEKRLSCSPLPRCGTPIGNFFPIARTSRPLSNRVKVTQFGVNLPHAQRVLYASGG